MAIQRVEVITGREARRQYSDEEKLRLVEEAFAPGVKTAEYARRASVDQSLLYRWRRQFVGQHAQRSAFTPVTVIPDEATSAEPTASPGMVEMEFPGGVRMRISGMVDLAVVTALVSPGLARASSGPASAWVAAWRQRASSSG